MDAVARAERDLRVFNIIALTKFLLVGSWLAFHFFG